MANKSNATRNARRNARAIVAVAPVLVKAPRKPATAIAVPETVPVAVAPVAPAKRRSRRPATVAPVPATVPVAVAVAPAALTVSAGTLAAWRAHRTMAEQGLKGASPTVRKAIKAKMAHYDALISAAIVAPKVATKAVRAAAKDSEVSPGTLAAWRAHRTMAEKSMAGASTAKRKELKAKIANYDAMLSKSGATAPVAAKAATVSEGSPARLAAYRAHRTMVAKKLVGTSGAVRKQLKAKIAHYEALISQFG